MELEEQAEELLETLWMHSEEEKKGPLPLDQTNTGRATIDQLLKQGYVLVQDGTVALTPKGLPEAANVVRRHRLAERLLVDVLNTKEDPLTHDKACKFEHLLDRGLDESICILLGHPKICPHGKPIPPGPCCRREQSMAHKLVSPLSRLSPGEKGKVAYIFASDTGKLQKLMAMGIHPGARIRLIQSFPAYVFEAEQTQFAVDREIADSIYVRLQEEAAAMEPAKPRRKLHLKLRRKR